MPKIYMIPSYVLRIISIRNPVFDYKIIHTCKHKLINLINHPERQSVPQNQTFKCLTQENTEESFFILIFF